ncbi:AfsR/SARP family transcriptional regulator [Actinomadura macrotermitis]|uniref:Bacterial transcriptional activator domain-containing protein n=1 Tax=Actinomadura macrotermitis TaxID=2585200 RepID=A0A7K0BWY8_9ACTN|nr:BTAD domain-containing putative transcriptional regulator [Actinomadura macrotermitis]MQY05687.1 hypothetical protein [Actinomadura macrotermitis]
MPVAASREPVVRLLPEFSCALPEGPDALSGAARRLVARLALDSAPLTRRAVETGFWPDAEPVTASRRLSRLLWRIRTRTGDTLVAVDGDRIGLAGGVTVDYRTAQAVVHAVIVLGRARPQEVGPAALGLLGTELLRDVTDEPVRRERDRWDRQRLLALETVAAAALEAGDARDALEIGLAAAEVDGLAERPHQLMCSAHAALGDTVAARRVYLAYEARVRRSLGMAPSRAFRDLVRG